MWAPDYVTVEEMREFISAGVNSPIAGRDEDLETCISAASRAIDSHTQRQFGKTTLETRYYTAEYDRKMREWVVITDDICDLTGIDIGINGEEVTGAVFEPVNALKKGSVFTQFCLDGTADVVPTGARFEVSVMALFGWSAIPTAIQHATKLQAHRFLKRQESPYGVAGSPDLGSEMRLLAKVDPDVAVSIKPYIRKWGVA